MIVGKLYKFTSSSFETEKQKTPTEASLYFKSDLFLFSLNRLWILLWLLLLLFFPPWLDSDHLEPAPPPLQLLLLLFHHHLLVVHQEGVDREHLEAPADLW